MLKDPGKSADTAKETVSGEIAYFTVPRKKLMGFRCGCAAGTDHKMEANIVRLVSVPFILMHMGRSGATNSTCSVISVSVVFGRSCSTLCAAQTVAVAKDFSIVLPNVFMGRMSTDGADARAVFGMRDSLFFTATIADDIMK